MFVLAFLLAEAHEDQANDAEREEILNRQWDGLRLNEIEGCYYFGH